MILSEKQIKSNIAYLKCGSSQGTAFLISSNKAITAYHCIEEYSDQSPIELKFKDALNSKIIRAIPINITFSIENQLDIIVLKLEEEILDQEYLELSKELIATQSLWKTFGYPQIENIDGIFLEGKVLYEKREDNPENYDLVVQSDESITSTQGMSGSPLIIDGKVFGIIVFDRAKRNTLGVISIKKAMPIFEKIEINVQEEIEIKEVVAIDNSQTEHIIFDYIKNNLGGYLFLKGSPGSGKTIFINNFKTKFADIDILGKYFLKGINEKYNIQYNSNKETLGKWLLDNISKYLYGSLYHGNIDSEPKLIKEIINYYEELSIKAKRENKKIIVFLDGIDEILLINKEQIQKFFSIFPSKIKDNIYIIISGNNEALLPHNIQLQSILDICPLEINKVSLYIQNSLNIKNNNLILIDKLAEKSEGNPLYLKYLIDEVTLLGELTENHIDDIPSFNGNIENYYNLFWSRISHNYSLVKILALIARTRKGILKDNLEKMLSMEERGIFGNNFLQLNHLINYKKDFLEIYHTSFENFVKEKTLNGNKDFHEIISKFCLNHKDLRYSLENKLYHLLNGNENRKIEALLNCSQEWLDDCSIKNINLELMLEDIKNVLDYSIDIGKFSEIIRILLLIERLTFRNEKLFKAFSVEISKALFEIGKGEYILNYLLKNEKLQENVSNRDAIYFLHKLFENRFHNEGNKLLRAIEKRCLEAFESSEVTVETLFLDLTSTTYTNPKLVIKKIQYYNNSLAKFNPEATREIMHFLVASHMAFLMKKDQFYSDLETLNKIYKTKPSQDSLNYVSEIILHYIDLQEKNYIKKKNLGLEKAIIDLEFLLKKYSSEENIKIILALINFSKNIPLLEKLIENESESEAIFNIRANNNVDFNFNDYLAFKNYWMLQGYLNLSLKEKEHLNWEEFLLIKIKEINIILGKCLRKNAENTIEDSYEIYNNLLKVLNSLSFSLNHRVSWNRSYHIPEDIIPQLYKEIAYIYSNFFELKIDDLKKHLFNNYQLGLYNEGYRRILFNVSIEIIKNESKKQQAFEILKKLEDFIDKYVLNRWERNRDFLNLIKLYGQIGAKERAELTFKKMLTTSMGPTWYKEDQLALMPSGIENLNNISQTEKYISEILGNLDYASGEMTFQRYVRDSKEQMVGVISESLNKSQSLEYLKKKICPSYEELLETINSDSFDILENSKGYIQGSSEIDIQDSMYSFIIKQKNIEPCLEFALTEIFLQGDERYFEDYIKLQMKILKQAQICSPSFYEKLTYRIKRQFIVELDELRRASFLEIIEKDNALLNLSKELKELDVPFDPIENSSFFNNNNIVKDIEEIPIIILAKQQIEIGNVKSVKEMLKNRLIAIQKENGDVFLYSNESLKCLDLLQELCFSESEFVHYLKDVCLNSYNLGWEVAHQLLKRAGCYLQTDDANNTIKEILEHMKLVLRTPKEYIKKYNWIQDKTLNNDDFAIEKYIIWLMNLPEAMIYSKKATEVLIWLGTEKPYILIPLLISDSLKKKKTRSSEASASILYFMSKTNLLETIWYCIANDSNVKEIILKEEHFMIKSYYYEITKLSRKVGLLYTEEYLYKLEENLFKEKEIITKKDIIWDNYSSLLNKNTVFYLKELEKAVGINTQFIDKLILEINDFISPITIPQLYEVDKIFERSYSLPEGLVNISTEDIKIVINSILSNWITYKNYNTLKKILRAYNPYFPESKYCLKIPTLHSNFKNFIQGKEPFNDNFLYYNDKLILHYDEIAVNREKGKGDRIEITAFLIENLKSIPNPSDSLYDSFYSNEEPEETEIKIREFKNILPLVNRCVYSACRNNWNTPSEIHSNFIKEYNIDIKDIERLNWRSGTILDVEGFGMPLQEGRILTIDKKYMSQIKKEYKLMYRLSYNLDKKLFFIDLKNKKIEVIY